MGVVGLAFEKICLMGSVSSGTLLEDWKLNLGAILGALSLVTLAGIV